MKASRGKPSPEFKPPFLKRLALLPDKVDRGRFPFDRLRFLSHSDFELEFRHPITFFVGENGSGNRCPFFRGKVTHENGIAENTAPDCCVDATVLESKVREWIISFCPQAEGQYDNHLNKVKAFDPGAAAEKRERLAALMRMVDGKRFVERLQRRWLNVNKDPSPQLADNVGQRHPRSDDLFEIVDRLRQSN